MKKQVKHLAALAIASLTTLVTTSCGGPQPLNSYPSVGASIPGYSNPGFNQPINNYPSDYIGIPQPGLNNNNPVLASNLPTGTIMGKVVDSLSKAGIGGVRVEVVGVRPAQIATTDASGNFTMSNIPQGNQVLTVQRNDYTNAAGNNQIRVSVNAGTTGHRNASFSRFFSQRLHSRF